MRRSLGSPTLLSWPTADTISSSSRVKLPMTRPLVPLPRLLATIAQAASVLANFLLPNKAPHRVQYTGCKFLCPLRPLLPIPAWLRQLDLDRLRLLHLRLERVIRRADNGSRPFLVSILERRKRTSSSILTAFALRTRDPYTYTSIDTGSCPSRRLLSFYCYSLSCFVSMRMVLYH
jgi:hypothetical protein